MKPTLLALILFFLWSCHNPAKQSGSPDKHLLEDQAYSFLDQGNTDSAFYYFDRARLFHLENQDSLGAAGALINMAIVQDDASDYFGSQETSLQALAYLKPIDSLQSEYIAMVYNNLGNVTDNLNDQAKAIDFYHLALHHVRDSINKATYRNNLGVVYRKDRQYEKALELFNEGLVTEVPESLGYARLLTNIANTMELKGEEQGVLPRYMEALRIRQKKGRKQDLNSSYAYLAKYYEKRNVDSAINYAMKRYEVANAINAPHDRSRALSQLIELNANPTDKSYFRIYKHITDSVNRARLSASNQFALIRYEVEKSKSEHLKLQKEHAETNLKLIWISLAGFFLLLGLILVLIFQQKRKNRLALEAENEIKASKLKTSKKVHDVVANGIYRVMQDIEHKPELNREVILDKLEDMYHKSRDIAHNPEGKEELQLPFSDQLAEMLGSFANPNCRVLIVGNEEDTWSGITKGVKTELKTALQELMVNMGKHSQASTVIIRMERQANFLRVDYKDNGIGFVAEKNMGNGIRNTVSRIESINGHIIFESGSENGLKIHIQIPIN